MWVSYSSFKALVKGRPTTVFRVVLWSKHVQPFLPSEAYMMIPGTYAEMRADYD